MSIVEWLLNRNITCVGTLRTDRKGIPDQVKSTDNRDDKSTIFYHCESLKSVLTSYVVKKTKGWKNVLVLSSMHDTVKVTRDERMKPSTIVFYDHTKGGVDIMAGVYTTRCKSRRWTMNAMSYVLDTVWTNMNTIWNEINQNEKHDSYDFMWALSGALVRPFIQHRYDNRNGLTKNIVVSMMNFLGIDEFQPLSQQAAIEIVDKQRCHFCILDIAGEFAVILSPPPRSYYDRI